MKKHWFYLITLLLITSCSENQFGDSQAPPKDFENTAVSEDLSEINAPGSEIDLGKEVVEGDMEDNIPKRKLIWTADLQFQVKDVDKSTQKIIALSEKYNGFISDMQMTNNPHRVSNRITMRVANSDFHKFVSAVKGESLYIDKANISSNDVTEEFVDIESRLKTKKEVRDRYVKILRNNTGSIQDVLEAEEAIRKITEEIEAKEGRLRYLQDKVDFSTVSIDIYQKVDYQAEPTIFEKPYSEELGDSFSQGWSGVKSIFVALVSIWPILLIVAGILFWQRKNIREVMGLGKK